MNLKPCIQTRIAVWLLTGLSPLALVKAQELSAKPDRSPTATQTEVLSERSERGEANTRGSEIEELRKQVQQLREIVEQQQQTLLKLAQRLESSVRTKGADDGAELQKVAANPESDSPNRRDGGGASGPVPTVSQPDPKAQKPAPLLAGWNGQHAFLRSADGNFETNITGYAQLDFRGYQHGNHPPNTFSIRRARVTLEGKVMRYFDFKIEGDFADTSSTLLRDFYVRFHRTNGLQFTFGQFRLPYSQEEIRSDAVQDFVERSLVNNLAPSRSPGVMASGVLRKGVIEYQIGAYNGKGLLANNTVGTPETAVRLRFTPWKNSDSLWIKGFTFGGTYSMGRNAINGTSVRGQTESRSFTFFSPEPVNGPIIRANGELTWTIGPAAIRGEYDQVNDFRNHLGSGGTNLPGLVAKGYVGQFTYLLTGESKSDSGAVAPKHPFFTDEKGARGFGAWELKFRYSSLQLDDRSAKSNRAQSIYTGVNWYLNNFVRYVLDFGFEHYRNQLLTPRPGDRNFFVVLSRVQVGW